MTAANFSPEAVEYLRRHGIDLDLAAELGVGGNNGRVAFPYRRDDDSTFWRTRPLGGDRTFQPDGEKLRLWWPEGREGATVLLCEGESDALAALTALRLAPGDTAAIIDGLTVAAVPGTGTPVKRVVSELRGAELVYLLLDADKAGRDAARKFGKALTEAGVDTVPVELLPDGFDLADYLHGHDDPGRALPELLANATEANREAGNNGGDSPEDGLLIDMAAAMKHADDPIPYVIDPLAPRSFLTVLAGRHSSFKSWLMKLAGHVAHRGGGEVAGLRCEATTVLYVDAENGPRLLARRFKDAGIPANGMLVADGTKLRLPNDLDQLRSLIEATGAGLVVLDSLRALAPGIRENESDDMAALVSAIRAVARDLDVAVVLIHHRSTKAGAATLRGSSSIEDQADLVFALEHVAGDPDRKRRRLNAGAREFVKPKTRAGSRTVPIVDRLALLLADHRVLMNHPTGGLLFESERVPGQPTHPTPLRRRLYAAWEDAELEPLGLHEARHTFASMMIAAGVNAKALSSYLGHANIAITFDRYGHLMPGSEAEARDRLNAYLNG